MTDSFSFLTAEEIKSVASLVVHQGIFEQSLASLTACLSSSGGSSIFSSHQYLEQKSYLYYLKWLLTDGSTSTKPSTVLNYRNNTYRNYFPLVASVVYKDTGAGSYLYRNRFSINGKLQTLDFGQFSVAKSIAASMFSKRPSLRDGFEEPFVVTDSYGSPDFVSSSNFPQDLTWYFFCYYWWLPMLDSLAQKEDFETIVATASFELSHAFNSSLTGDFALPSLQKKFLLDYLVASN